ncbi:hypothetical protein [Halorubrum tropicale]|uniref:Domain of unknown function domain-containing protein n=1 Tax=Halorubrum tropicale TaxID=1765655 RepID=A0A0M9AL52_9EURY|nr:hypothetical protein [Halorubrum tropicale]KOX94212.1 hypothetical protein AMR74_15985 [Halorubrum tropicale]
MADAHGFLTDVDKEFLRGEKEYSSKQGRYDRRRAIRERTREAFRDFQLLQELLDTEERDKIFDPPTEDRVGMLNAMTDTIAFMYHALEGDAESGGSPASRSITVPFEFILETGIRHGEVARQESINPAWGGDVDVTIDIDLKQLHTTYRERVIEELARNGGRGLTDEEIRATIVHAARDTASRASSDEDLPEDELASDLYGLAAAVEKKAAELDDEDQAASSGGNS